MTVFLGVDGGGTKTALCLLDADGSVVASARERATYYLPGPVELVERVLREGVTQVCASAGVNVEDLSYAFFGLPGYGEVSGDIAILNALPRRILGHDRYACENDSVCAWAGSLGGEDGINVVAGTGSIAYGQREGHGVRAGGFGELFGDEGSAYWVATRALNTVSRMIDGRLARGPLLDAIRARLQLTADLELIGVVLHHWEGDRGRIAELSTLVDDAADQGDACAAAILADAGRELATLALAVRRQLGHRPADRVSVSHAGGAFESTRILASFRDQLGSQDACWRLAQPLYPPVVGAALYAARLAGSPLGTDARERLRHVVEEPPRKGENDGHVLAR